MDIVLSTTDQSTDAFRDREYFFSSVSNEVKIPMRSGREHTGKECIKSNSLWWVSWKFMIWLLCSHVYFNLGMTWLLHIRKTNMSGHNTPWHEFLSNNENWYVLNPKECLFRGNTIMTSFYLMTEAAKPINPTSRNSVQSDYLRTTQSQITNSTFFGYH